MDMMILNQNFEKIAVIDGYESLLWVDRYNEPGELEIYTPMSDTVTEFYKVGYYIQLKESNHTMIIEDFSIESKIETGNHAKIRGRSLESILDRRIIWEQVNYTGNLQNAVQDILNKAFISPSIADRTLSNFIFEASEDTNITGLTIEAQYTGDNVLDVINKICKDNEIGYSVTLNDSNQFVFKLYKGVDRSYKQESLPYVIFKPSFENIIKSNYSETNSTYKNVTLVAGEGEGASRVTRTVGGGSGLSRKELYTDARDIQREEGMSWDTYYSLLDTRGNENLKEYKVDKFFEGECETTKLFVYGRDFNMGDVVQVANEYGIESPARIIEYIYSSDESGTLSYPTFEAMDYENEE